MMKMLSKAERFEIDEKIKKHFNHAIRFVDNQTTRNVKRLKEEKRENKKSDV